MAVPKFRMHPKWNFQLLTLLYIYNAQSNVCTLIGYRLETLKK
jgi:hypothetical protein